jgi:hypothetical protein
MLDVDSPRMTSSFVSNTEYISKNKTIYARKAVTLSRTRPRVGTAGCLCSDLQRGRIHESVVVSNRLGGGRSTQRWRPSIFGRGEGVAPRGVNLFFFFFLLARESLERATMLSCTQHQGTPGRGQGNTNKESEWPCSHPLVYRMLMSSSICSPDLRFDRFSLYFGLSICQK